MRTFVPNHEPIELVDYYEEVAAYYPLCELQTKRWFVENVVNGWTIFDIGANIGYYSILFSRLTPNGRVIAFEPTASVLKLLRNLSAHKIENVRLEALALSDSPGSREDGIFKTRGNEAERGRYFFETVDNYVAARKIDRVDCLKMYVGADGRFIDFAVAEGVDGDDVAAMDGEEVFRKMASASPDALLLDIYMPKLSGRDTFKELRAVGNCVPVVVCSGFVIDPDEFMILSQGHPPPVDIMLKPYSLDGLSKALAKAVQKPQGRESAFDLTADEGRRKAGHGVDKHLGGSSRDRMNRIGHACGHRMNHGLNHHRHRGAG